MVPNKIYKPLYESARYFIFLIAALDFYPHFFMYICHLFFIYLCLFGYTHAIQNGTVVTDWTQYSFYAAMGNPRLCGGAFLSFNPTWVLTAAHCVVNTSTTPPTKNGYYIMYGNTTRSTSHIAWIESWIMHPQYTNNNSDVEHDIAVVKIQNNSIFASSGVSRIPLLSSAASLQNGQQAWIMGYGYTSVGGSESSQLRAINETISYVDANSPDLIRANTWPYSGVCHGDSGKHSIAPGIFPLAKGFAEIFPLPTIYPQFGLSNVIGGPLVVQQNGIWTIVGTTARILNAYDPIPSSPTCAISYNESQQSEDGYVNVALQLNWISNVTGLSIAQLTANPTGVTGNGTSASSDSDGGYQTTSGAAKLSIASLTCGVTLLVTAGFGFLV